MEEERQPKWEGKTSVEMASVKPEQAWPCIEDFCNIHKWFPSIDACCQLEGEPGKPGLIRYCTSTTVPLSLDGTDDQKSTTTNTTTTTTKWAKEKLLMIDPIQRCLSYEIIDNNFGFNSYVATSKVLPIDGGGCKIEWSYVADPIEGWSQEGMTSFIDFCVQYMAKKMEQEHLLLQTSGSV